MSDHKLSTRTIIGLEIHVQLATRSKMFCDCAVEFAAAPNSRVCPVCLGLPGALPVMNRQAVRMAVTAGLALNCRIASFTKWDRKNYYYPDLPKNYQISQYDLPLGRDGYFDIQVQGHPRRVSIIRAHLEEDAGKNIHDKPGCTLVDLNRTGTPLLEIVTGPDLRSAEEVYTFAIELQRLVTCLGISEGVMQKGQMRFEPNVNVAITSEGLEYRTPISEIKNLNSFKALRRAVEYESDRQVRDWLADRAYLQGQRPNENRGWNDEGGITRLQRAKEEVHDYRYFPEPDLVPVELDPLEVAEIRAALPELPLARRARFVSELGLSAKDAETIVADRATADLFEQAVAAGGPASVLSKQFVNVWAKLAHERGVRINELPPDAERIAALARMVAEGVVSATAANQIADRMLDSPDSPESLAESMALVRVSDSSQMDEWVDQVLAANERTVQTILSDPKKAKAGEGFLRGQVMRLSGGKADPKLAGELIARRIEEIKSAAG